MNALALLQAAAGSVGLDRALRGGPFGAPRRTAGPARPAAAGARITLADGRCARLRPVSPGDLQAEEAFVAALSPQSRRMRFHGAMKQLPPAVLRAMTAIDQQRHVAWVAEAGCADGAARLVGDARYVIDDPPQAGHGRPAPAPAAAEFALAVADDWQGIGLGSAMLQRLVRHARARGLALLRGSVLVDNAPMLALVRRLGARLRDDPTDATLVQVSLSLWAA